jgi:acyl carrier protein
MPSDSIHEVKLEVKKLIIETLKFNNVKPEEIIDDVTLFSGQNAIKIDSIDVIELTVSIQKKFNVKIDNKNLAKEVINTVDSIANFIYTQHHKS